MLGFGEELIFFTLVRFYLLRHLILIFVNLHFDDNSLRIKSLSFLENSFSVITVPPGDIFLDLTYSSFSIFF